MQDKSLHTSPQLEFVEQNGVAVALSHKQVFSLYKKSEQSGIPFETLEEVYRRGYREAIVLQETPEQYAFNRVNSFISGGAAVEMDQDLSEKIGLWDRIHAKRERIKHGSGEHMRKPGSKGAPTAAAFKAAQSTSEEIQVDEKFSNEYMKTGREYLKLKRAKEKAAKNPAKKISGNEADDLVKQYLDKGGKITKKESYTAEAYGKGYVSPAEKIKKAMAKKGVNIDNDKHRAENEKLKAQYQSIVDKDKVKEEYTGAEKTSKDKNDPTNRFAGTDSLVNNYKEATPGQSTLKTIKKIVREQIEINECANGKCSCARNMEEDAKGYKNPTGGLTQKGRDHYNRESGGHLKAPVTTEPSKLKSGSKAANRRKSFCARMGGMKKRLTSAKTANDPDSRINKALRKWNC
jgi:hypothetical protein